MSAQALRFPSAARHVPWPYAIPVLSGIGLGCGVLLESILVVAVSFIPLAIWLVHNAPEAFLVLLAAEGTLKAVPPFTASPIDLLYVTIGLLVIGCVLRIKAVGFPRVTLAPGLMVVLMTLLLVAAIHTSSLPGGTYKALYFEAVSGGIFFAPLILVRDTAAFARLAVAFVLVGLIVAHASTPGLSPGEPYTLPGGSEITAAYFPAMGAIAALTCLAMRTFGIRRVLLFVLAGVLAAAAVRAGSRGVLIAVSISTVLAFLLLVLRSRRPVIALGLALLVLGGSLVAGRQVIGTSALQRYSALTTDTRRDYLRTHALDQALDHPLGVGIGAYGLNLPVLSPRPSVPYPHNIVLEIFNESGIIALDAFVALVAWAFLRAVGLSRRRGYAFCAVGLAFTFVEALASGSVNDDGVLWLMLGLTFAAAQIPVLRPGAGEPAA